MTDISHMLKEDVEGVFSVEEKSFSLPWSKDAFFEELENQNAITFVAKNAGKIVGFINAHLIIDECYINNIAVLKDFKTQGIGSLLLGELVEFIKKGAVFVSLEVRETNFSAIKLYEKFGFIKKGERKDFYEKPIENALIYTLFFKE